MLFLIFVAVTPLIVFFGVFFLVMRWKKSFYYFVFVIAAVFGVVTFVVSYVIAFNLERQFGAMAVQAALDEQCGKGHYVADAKGYNSDPFPSWHGEGVTCYILDSSQKDWICDCASPTDKKPWLLCLNRSSENCACTATTNIGQRRCV